MYSRPQGKNLQYIKSSCWQVIEGKGGHHTNFNSLFREQCHQNAMRNTSNRERRKLGDTLKIVESPEAGLSISAVEGSESDAGIGGTIEGSESPLVMIAGRVCRFSDGDGEAMDVGVPVFESL
jgi:hypothetical protein